MVGLGGYGGVSVVSDVVGRQIRAMMSMILEGAVEKAAAEHLRLLEIFKIMFVVSNPIPIKYAVRKAGFDVGNPRLPLVQADEATAAKIDAVVSRYDIDLPVAVGGSD